MEGWVEGKKKDWKEGGRKKEGLERRKTIRTARKGERKKERLE